MDDVKLSMLRFDNQHKNVVAHCIEKPHLDCHGSIDCHGSKEIKNKITVLLTRIS